jgi:hypothetical protein
MKITRWAFAAVLLTAFSSPAADGWISLSGGNSITGWTPRGEVTSFTSKNGVISLETKKNVWVTSDLKLADFIAELEVKLPDRENFNSGLAFRCTGATGKPKGYQAEIDARKANQSGGVYGIGLGGWLYPKAADKQEFLEKTRGLFKLKDWNTIRVKAVGPRIQTWVNGQPVADIKDSKSLKGFFGIQHHGGDDVVMFRNIRVKDLGNSK